VGFDKDGEKHFQIPRGVYAAETARDVANHVLKWQGWNT
jgi:uncharacterized C2H2 Zn-finger protein